MKYEIDLPTYCTIELQPVSKPVESFFVNYHADSGMPDFLVLASKVARSLSQNYSKGDRIKMFYPDEEEWYYGEIVNIRPKDEQYPDSPWESLVVKWQLDSEESISPWEVQPFEKAIDTSESIECIEPEEEKAIIETLKKIQSLEIARPFRFPVPNNTPRYKARVAYPMDLSTLIERLENHFYRRKEALLFDMNLIRKNAASYNQINSQIVRDAKKLDILLQDTVDATKRNAIDFSQFKIDEIQDLKVEETQVDILGEPKQEQEQSQQDFNNNHFSNEPFQKKTPPKKKLVIKLRNTQEELNYELANPTQISEGKKEKEEKPNHISGLKEQQMEDIPTENSTKLKLKIPKEIMQEQFEFIDFSKKKETKEKYQESEEEEEEDFDESYKNSPTFASSSSSTPQPLRRSKRKKQLDQKKQQEQQSGESPNLRRSSRNRKTNVLFGEA